MFLKPIEHKLLKVMLEHQSYMTTKEIAERARVSWNSAEKYLKRFYLRGWVSKYSSGNRDYWLAKVRFKDKWW